MFHTYKQICCVLGMSSHHDYVHSPDFGMDHSMNITSVRIEQTAP